MMALDTVLADHCYCLSTVDPDLMDAENSAGQEIRRSKRQKERSLPTLGLTPVRHFDEYDSTKLAPCRIARWTSLFSPHRRRKKEKPSRKVLFSQRPGTDDDSNDGTNSPVKHPPKPPSAADAWKRLLHVRMNLIYKAQQETLRLWQLIQGENLERLVKNCQVESETSSAQTTGANSKVAEQANCLDADTCNKCVKEIFDQIDPLLSSVDNKPDAAAMKEAKHVTPSVLQHMYNGAASMAQHKDTTEVHQGNASNVPQHGDVSNVPQHSDVSNVPQRSDASNGPQASNASQRSGTPKKRSEQEVKFQLRNPNTTALNNGLHLVRKDDALKYSEAEHIAPKQVKGNKSVHKTEHVNCDVDLDECDTMDYSETEQLTPDHSEAEFVPKHKKRKRRHKKLTRAYVPGSRQFCVSHDFSIIFTTDSPIWCSTPTTVEIDSRNRL